MPQRWAQRLTWKFNNNANNDFWYDQAASGSSHIILRANSPYDPWYPADNTTGSARWYNTVSTLFQREKCNGCSIKIKYRNLFPVSGNRYTGYFRIFLVPCNYGVMNDLHVNAYSMKKLEAMPGCVWKDIGPLDSKMAFGTLKGYVRPPSILYGRPNITSPAGVVNSLWRPVKTNGATEDGVYWFVTVYPIKPGAHTAGSIATAEDSLLIDITCKFYMLFGDPISDQFTGAVDDIVGTDSLGTGEADPPAGTADLTDVPGNPAGPSG